ncbi:tripartite tricarboxylate transporter substrate binding protein [Pollutimonas bauzanensis]|uniref:Bug family tripartite tricarboxylate transporter substrate binding protein n=1 Tax=Pollutimonas bauzanensis TaxID=658167 RepID=UPI00333E618C
MQHYLLNASFKFGAALVIAIGGSVSSAQATSTTNYPNRPITMTVGYSAGGGSDVATRLLARIMEKDLGQSIVIVNKPGAQATINAGYVAKGPADGYTVGSITMAPIVVVPHMTPVSYTTDDFKFIGGFGRFSYAIAVQANSPYKTVEDLVAEAKKKPVFFSAAGSPNNIGMFELGKKSGGQFEQVLYKSGSEAVLALASGNVQATVQPPGDLLPQMASGKIRILASISADRISSWPDVPTVREQGYDVAIESWMGIAVPAGTPEPIARRLEASLLTAMQDPEMIEGLKQFNLDPIPKGSDDYTKLIKEQYEIIGRSIKENGLAGDKK